jgi:hypothetical protein
MDLETRTVIISILETLRHVADTAFEAREMAFKNFTSLRSQPGYEEAYQSQKSDLLEEIQTAREQILTRLNAQLHLLQDM